MSEYKAQEPIVIKQGDKISLSSRKKGLPNYFNYCSPQKKLSISIEFYRQSAFLRLTFHAFGNLAPNEIKRTICEAVDEYYELK